MRKKKMLEAMSLLDDSYVAEAAPDKRKTPRRAWITVAATAACFALILGSFGIYRLVDKKRDELAPYRDSEYYPLMQKLKDFRDTQALDITYTTSNISLLARLFGAKTEDKAAPEAIADGDTLTTGTGSQTYEEATDNQVEGVIEGDLIKRSDRYIYYLERRKALLHVYAIEGEETHEVGSFAVTLPNEEGHLLTYKSYSWELYLSADCRTLSVIAPYYKGLGNNRARHETAVISLDVSDPTAIVEKNRVTVAGEYHSSRVVDGTMYLLNRFYVQSDLDFAKEETFVPQIDVGNGFESLPMSQIVLPDEMSALGYTVICCMDAETLTLRSSLGCLSYVDDLYASRDALYLVRSRTEVTEEGKIITQQSKSDIFRVSYTENSLTPQKTVTVDGEVKDQYSLDEYRGILRVVTSTRVEQYEKTRKYATFLNNEEHASLFAVDVASMQIVSSVERFAPAGETVRSVRFDGERGYVCTAIQLTDPVFFFDLSDLHNITYTDTGTIPGFSTSLIQYGNGMLLGVGQGENGQTKVEIYKQVGNSVLSLDSYTVEGSSYYGTEYKSYLIDREHGLFGVVVHPVPGNAQYMIFSLNGGHLELIETVSFGTEHHMLADYRGLYIDGCVYVFADGSFAVRSLLGPQS